MLRRFAGIPRVAVALVLSLFLCAGAATQSRAQAPDQLYIIDKWEIEQGLPENSATAMVQTSDGYLWFGTFNGLARFDGMRFTVFDPGNTPELPSAGVVNLHLDRAGTLWVGTLNGLVARSRMGWRSFGAGDGWDGDVVKTFTERSNGDLLITTFDGRVLEFAGDRFRSLPMPPGHPRSAYAGLVDRDDRWWVVQDGFIGCWDGREWVPTLEPPTNAAGHVACGQARDRGLWFILGDELRKYHGTQLVHRRTLPERLGTIWHIFEDSRGYLWVSTIDRGVCRISPGGEVHRWDSTKALSHDGVRFVFEDAERMLWVGTSGGGLARFRPRRVQHIGTQNGLQVQVVKSVWPDAAGVWVATYGGGLHHLRDGAVTRVPLNWESGPADYVQSVLTDRRGRTWVGTYKHGLFCLADSGTRTFPLADTGGGNVISLFEDSRGRIWASGGLGVSVFDEGRLRPFAQDQPQAGQDVRCFAEDGRGTIWVSNLRGVFQLIDGRFREVTAPDGAALAEIVCIRFERDGTVWMGSRTAGLLRWKADRVDHIDMDRGLPVRSVYGIMEDERGFWWMPTNRGVIRAGRGDLEAVADGRVSRLTCQLLGVRDGMATVECTGGRQPVCARDADGVMWFATTKGLVSIDPGAFEVNPVVPQTHIEEFFFEKESLPHGKDIAEERGGRTNALLGATQGERLTLPAGSRHLQIHYTATSLVASENVRFQTMLEGLEASWQDAGSRRTEYFHNLPPGDYVFRVRAANNDGVWNETGSHLAFTVLPHVWQTRWFTAGWVSLLAIGLVAASWWHARMRMRHTHEHMEFVEQRNVLSHLSRVTMLGELSGSLAHELNQPLTAILSNAQAAQRFLACNPPGIGDLREILTDIEAESKRAGEVISRLRLLLKKGEPVQSALDVAATIREVLRLLRSDLINHRVVVDADLDPDLPTVRADRIQIQQVLVNLMTNACEAMAAIPEGSRRLTVAARAGTQGVLITVRDSGSGIAAAHLGRIFEPFFTTKPTGMGLGLSVCRTIMKANNGDLVAGNHPNGGAEFCIVLPAMSETGK